MEKIKKINVKCIKLNEQGLGIVSDNKTTYEVKNILPKEEGIMEINYSDKFVKTKMVKLTKTSSDRSDVKCGIYNRCGSCHLLHMNYNAQIEFKKNYVLNCFKQEKIRFKIDEVIKAEKLTEYRNKLQVAFKMVNGKIISGFYEEGTHKIIPMETCLVHSEKQLKIVNEVRKIMTKLRITPYDEDRRTGCIRFLLLREALLNEQMLVTIVTSSEIFPGRNEFIKQLVSSCPYITTIVQNINPRKTSIVLGEQERVLYGKGFIEEYLCGIKFKLSSKSFFQINPYQTEKLYNKVKEFAGFTGDETIIDAYCGVGTIGSILASGVKQVIGIESNRQAYNNAILNARDNKIKNIKFFNADATEFIYGFAKENIKIDAVIMDPPRTGSTEKFINTVLNLSPKKVIYVSCEAQTLARDLKLFIPKYNIEKTAICDLFVGTYHIEAVCLLTLKN